MQSWKEGVCLLNRADIKAEIAAYWLAAAICQVIFNVSVSHQDHRLYVYMRNDLYL